MFQPAVPLSGLVGWEFLQRTRETQQAAFNASAQITRNVEYFEENIGKITSAEELVNDRQLLEVALGAFGLDEDINSKFLIQKVLSDGTLDPDALANRFSDKRYYDMSKAFGFDLTPTNLNLSTFATDITSAYKERQFEIAVGNVNNTMRLAMSLDRELGKIADKNSTDDSRWFQVMGNPPVREVFETALNLPSAFGALNLDQQLSGFRDALSARFGNAEISQFTDATKRQELIDRFIVQAEIQSFSTAGLSSGNIALSLLQGGF